MDGKMNKDSFIFYRSFYEAISALDDEDRLQLFDAICELALNQSETELKPIPKAMFTLIKPQLEANNKRFENGKKGGRPRKEQNQSETENKPNENQNETKAEPNKNVNVNVNENVNSNENQNVNSKEVTISQLEAGEVANYLADKIISEKPDAKIKPEKWVPDIEKAIRIDGRSKQALISCINWIYSDEGEFWKPNIMSGDKLRKQYDKMDMQARSRKQQKTDPMMERVARLAAEGRI